MFPTDNRSKARLANVFARRINNKPFFQYSKHFLTTSLILRKNKAKEKLTTGTWTVCLCHRDNSDHEVCVSSLSNKHFEKKSFSKKIDIVQSLDFLWKTKNTVFQEKTVEKRSSWSKL